MEEGIAVSTPHNKLSTRRVASRYEPQGVSDTVDLHSCKSVRGNRESV